MSHGSSVVAQRWFLKLISRFDREGKHFLSKHFSSLKKHVTKSTMRPLTCHSYPWICCFCRHNCCLVEVWFERGNKYTLRFISTLWKNRWQLAFARASFIHHEVTRTENYYYRTRFWSSEIKRTFQSQRVLALVKAHLGPSQEIVLSRTNFYASERRNKCLLLSMIGPSANFFFSLIIVSTRQGQIEAFRLLRWRPHMSKNICSSACCGLSI